MKEEQIGLDAIIQKLKDDILDALEKGDEELAAKYVAMYNTLVKTGIDLEDKKAKQDLEYRKLINNLEVEEIKSRLTPGKAAMEIAKVIVPTILTLLGYDIFQRRLMIYEKDGKIVSTAGRELHLPRFLR